MFIYCLQMSVTLSKGVENRPAHRKLILCKNQHKAEPLKYTHMHTRHSSTACRHIVMLYGTIKSCAIKDYIIRPWPYNQASNGGTGNRRCLCHGHTRGYWLALGSANYYLLRVAPPNYIHIYTATVHTSNWAYCLRLLHANAQAETRDKLLVIAANKMLINFPSRGLRL